MYLIMQQSFINYQLCVTKLVLREQLEVFIVI